MASVFSHNDRAKARLQVQPPPIIDSDKTELDGLVDFINFSSADIARGMMNEARFRLVELLHNVVSPSDPIRADILLSGLDNVNLTVALKAFLMSSNSPHTGDIMFGVPPLSYSYALLLAYHLILHHIGTALSGNDLGRFSPDSGILIISDNIELIARIWRTSVNGVVLRDFISTFSVRSGHFEKFNISTEGIAATSPKNSSTYDASLPWLAHFRAFRTELPKTLDMNPKVVILDFLPYRHRKRAANMVEWARSMSEHVIAVAPRHDQIYECGLSYGFKYVVPVSASEIRYLENVGVTIEGPEENSVVASWTLGGAIPYVRTTNRKFTVAQVTGVDDLESTFIRLMDQIQSIYKRRPERKPRAVEQLQWILNDLMSLCVPLQWYDRSRMVNRNRTFEERFELVMRIPPEDSFETSVYKFLLPEILDGVASLYTALKIYDSNPKGEVLTDFVIKYVNRGMKVLVVVPDEFAASEFKAWIRSKNVIHLDNWYNLKVVSQSKWAREQIRQIIISNDEHPDAVICVGPWRKTYLSSFYFPESCNVHFISYSFENRLISHQINLVYSFTPKDITAIGTTLMNMFNVPSEICEDVAYTEVRSIEINTDHCPAKSIIMSSQVTKDQTTNGDLGTLLDPNILYELVNSGEDDLTDESGEVQGSTDPIIQAQLFPGEEWVQSVLIEVRSVGGGASRFVYLNTDQTLKVVRYGDQDITPSIPLELHEKDLWVRLKQNERRELFQSILDMSSGALTMQWIEMNMQEWRDMLGVVWGKFARSHVSKKEVCEKIAQEIRRQGGTVESFQTIATWISGEVSSVRDKANVRAIANITDDPRFKERWRQIYAAMRQLWTLHIGLGRMLGRIIYQQAASLADGRNDGEWLDLGADIKVPIEDVLSVLDIREVLRVDRETIYKVIPEIADVEYDDRQIQVLESKGVIVRV